MTDAKVPVGVETVPDFLIWHCAGCGKPARGNVKPCNCATMVGTRTGPHGDREQTWFQMPDEWLLTANVADVQRHITAEQMEKLIYAAQTLSVVTAERDRQYEENAHRIHQQALAENERDALAARVEKLEAALKTASKALHEATAILGGEYGDFYGVLAERMAQLEHQIDTLLPAPTKGGKT